MTHADLIARAERWLLKTKGCGFVLTELASYAGEIPDAIGWQHTHSHLVECKVTRADFLSDAKKRFRHYPEQGMGNYRWYMCPPDVIREADLPFRWGLTWVFPKSIKIVRKPVGFFGQRVAANERYLFYSALRRVHLRGDLKKIFEHKR